MKTESLIIIAMLFSLSGCSPQKKFVDNAPFTLGEPICYEWAGGRAETGGGTMLQIPMDAENFDVQNLRQAFFRGKIGVVETEEAENGMLLKVNFRKNSGVMGDRIMHSDPKKEVGNQTPMSKDSYPFELAEDECVISYAEGLELKYIKITNIKQTKPKMYQ